MKNIKNISIVLLTLFAVTQIYTEEIYAASSNSNAVSQNQISSSQNQVVSSQGGSASAQGGTAVSDSDSIAISGDSGAIANISTNSTSNYETRTPPVSMFPPYLPTFSHGGWGTIQGYFPNGPTAHDTMYERAFYPNSKLDMKELKGVMNDLSYDGPIGLLSGILNGVGTIFGGPDNFHHGKGFEISNSIVRKRRPKNRPLYVLIDSNINRDYLKTTGYTYVGKLSLEGKVDRNWDLVYKAAIAEAIPWDVDVMLISGGMKGVTVGTNTTFPGIAGAYSQTNYSVSMLGGKATGITEGKGVAMVSAECYRYNPEAAQRRAIPEAFYKKIHAQNEKPQRAELSQTFDYLLSSEPLPQAQTQRITEPETRITSSSRIVNEPVARNAPVTRNTPVARNTPMTKGQAVNNKPAQAPVQKTQRPYVGVPVSQELYEMAGFTN